VVTGDTRVCPVCDSTIDADVRQCPECNTDLSLFDVDSRGFGDSEKASPSDGKSIDDILASIVAGKDVRPGFFEDIRTIATDGTAADDDILGGADEEPGAEFECPSCGTRVASNAQVCPGCGAQFADEQVEQFECPLCNAVVDVDATACPNCGVQFAQDEAPARPAPPARAPAASSPPKPSAPAQVAALDELELDERATARPPTPTITKLAGPAPMERLWSLVEGRKIPPEDDYLDRASLYKELPRLVNEVKPLLLVAKKVGVEIGQEKELISEAIAYGKKRDVERAVKLIREARFRLEETFTSNLAKRIETVLVEAERTRQTGGDVGAILNLCVMSIEALERRDYSASADRIRSAKEEFDARSGGYAKARQEYEGAKSLLVDARKLGMEMREAETFLKRSEAALQARNWDQAAGLAVQARQSLLKNLPDVLNKEMKKARNALLDMKVKGGDLTKSVGILKQASIHMKREEYGDALKFIVMFRDEIGKP
jgi:hypothetical protein